MLGPNPSLSAQMAAERHARFATEAAGARWRRQLHQRHPAPRLAGIATQLPRVVIDLTAGATSEAEPSATR